MTHSAQGGQRLTLTLYYPYRIMNTVKEPRLRLLHSPGGGTDNLLRLIFLRLHPNTKECKCLQQLGRHRLGINA